MVNEKHRLDGVTAGAHRSRVAVSFSLWRFVINNTLHLQLTHLRKAVMCLRLQRMRVHTTWGDPLLSAQCSSRDDSSEWLSLGVSCVLRLAVKYAVIIKVIPNSATV